MFYVLLVIICVVLYWKLRFRRPKGMPPGPEGIPIFGNAFQLGVQTHLVSFEARHKYGDIQSYKSGTTWAMILLNPDDIREAFNHPNFTGRTGLNILLEDSCENVNCGLLNSTGEKWHYLRRFTHRTLRDFGFTKRTSENIILEEATALIEELGQKVGQPLKTETLFNISVVNVIWEILAGERHAHDDPRMSNFVHMIESFFNSLISAATMIMFFFPGMINIRNKHPYLFPKKAGEDMRQNLFKYFKEVVRQHRETIQKGQPRDYIDALIEEADQNDQIEEMDFVVTLSDFFLAGSETTSTMLQWSLFTAAQFPDLQEKIYQEIQGDATNRQVSVADRPNLSLMDNFFQELFRFASIAPVGAPHAATEDTHFKGYFIPKKTAIISNIYAAHHSPEIWGDPETFRPERFADGKVGARHKAWMPFGTGRRSCLGESLARDEFFLFFTNIVRNFKISYPTDEPRQKMALPPFTGGTIKPPAHKIVLQHRA